ncbi:hypothetical protein PLICRDRAFT_112190, partial [Plicaturopsis crispa FD-325 SS-3]
VYDFAVRHPDIAFTHAYPGGVRTPMLRTTTGIARYTIGPVVHALLYPFTLSQEESGDYMLRALLSSEKGANYKGSRAKNSSRNPSSTPEARKKLWDHTVEATTV